MTDLPQPNQDMLDKTAENIRRGEYQTAKEIIATMTDDPKTSASLVATLRAELERHRINMTITGGYAVSLLADTVDRIIAALARAESAERERDDALAEAASLHGAECIENAALRSLAEAAERNAAELARMMGCLEPSERGIPSCDPPCLACAALLAAQPGASATRGER